MVNIYGMIKTIFDPQNLSDAILSGWPTKPVAIATSAISSGIALYVIQPETLFSQATVVVLSSGLSWASVETAHHIACQLWQKRQVEENPVIRISEEQAQKIKEKMHRALDDAFSPESMALIQQRLDEQEKAKKSLNKVEN